MYPFTITLIPHTKTPICLLREEKVAVLDRVQANTDAIQRWLDKNITGEPWQGKLVIQAPPWHISHLKTQPEILHVRQLTETTTRWATLCELRGIRNLYVPRPRWITQLIDFGLAKRNPMTDRIDTKTAAERFAKREIHPNFADVVCFAYWHAKTDVRCDDADLLAVEQVE